MIFRISSMSTILQSGTFCRWTAERSNHSANANAMYVTGNTFYNRRNSLFFLLFNNFALRENKQSFAWLIHSTRNEVTINKQIYYVYYWTQNREQNGLRLSCKTRRITGRTKYGSPIITKNLEKVIWKVVPVRYCSDVKCLFKSTKSHINTTAMHSPVGKEMEEKETAGDSVILLGKLISMINEMAFCIGTHK